MAAAVDATAPAVRRLHANESTLQALVAQAAAALAAHGGSGKAVCAALSTALAAGEEPPWSEALRRTAATLSRRTSLSAQTTRVRVAGYEAPARPAAPTDLCFLYVGGDAAPPVEFDVGVFVIPPGGVIPLHDHPHMASLSAILCGAARFKNYNNNTTDRRPGGWTRRDTVRDARSEAAWLLPEADNHHVVANVSETASCVMLSIDFPPYNDVDGRPCNYYDAVETDGEALSLRHLVGAKDPRIVQIEAIVVGDDLDGSDDAAAGSAGEGGGGCAAS